MSLISCLGNVGVVEAQLFSGDFTDSSQHYLEFAVQRVSAKVKRPTEGRLIAQRTFRDIRPVRFIAQYFADNFLPGDEKVNYKGGYAEIMLPRIHEETRHEETTSYINAFWAYFGRK